MFEFEFPYSNTKENKIQCDRSKIKSNKGSVKLMQLSENSSFIFTVCVRSVPRYHFKLAHVILQMAVKDFSKPTSKNREIGRLNRSLLIESF